MADITIIRNGARISLANFPKLGSGSENIAVAVSASGDYDTYTTELYYGWYQGSSMQKMIAKYQNGLYYIPSNALFNAGNVYLTLRLVNGDNKVSTNTIPITIEKSAVNNEYSILPASETWQKAVDNYINNSINLLNERLDNLEVECVLKNARDKAPSGLFIYTKDVELFLSADESKHIVEKTGDYENKIIPIDLLDMKFVSNDGFCNVSSVTRYRDNGRKWLDIIVHNTSSNVSKSGTIRLVILAYDKEKLS